MAKMYLIFHGRFPSEKAASLFVAKSAEAFAECGVEVEVIVPRRLGRAKQDPWDYYAVKKSFTVTYLPTIDLFWLPLGSLSFYISLMVFSVCTSVWVYVKSDKRSVVYTNEILPTLLFSQNMRSFYELHDFPEKNIFFYKLLFKKVSTIIVTNAWKAERLQSVFRIPKTKMLYEPNAVDVRDFDIDVTKREARSRLNIDHDHFLVVYTGHLYGWKGVDTLAQSVAYMPEHIRVVCVGGTETDVERMRSTYAHENRLQFIGHRPHTEIPLWQKAADILVLPNTGKQAISRFYTSPMKLFEYMASRTPIVASRIQSISELLNDKNALLFEPDNPQALAQAITAVESDMVHALKRAEQAYADVLDHTWLSRAKRIIMGIRLE